MILVGGATVLTDSVKLTVNVEREASDHLQWRSAYNGQI
jgi:riboflavin biosynthesis pyrimidine reductase